MGPERRVVLLLGVVAHGREARITMRVSPLDRRADGARQGRGDRASQLRARDDAAERQR